MSITQKMLSVEDARRYARKSVPRVLFNYIDRGAEGEITQTLNEEAFRDIAFCPRVGRGLPSPQLHTTVVGMPISLPVLLAPCGLVRIMHHDGIVGIFRAARRSGTIATLSTFAGSPPEVVAEEPGPRWFQLYATNRDMAANLLGRAAGSGFEALVVTLDSATAGKRGQDAGHGIASTTGLTVPDSIALAPQLIVRPRWSFKMLKTTLSTFGDAKLPTQSDSPLGPLQTVNGGLHRQTPPPVSPFTWDDITWIRDQWSGPLLLKGILSPQDARRAVDVGADAVVVSNHGGRQLESSPATIRVLAGIVDTVGADAEVLVDSGFRSGADVVKALALGARAVLIGRPYCYGLAAAGELGVHRVIEIFRADMARTMALMGCSSVHDLDRSWIQAA